MKTSESPQNPKSPQSTWIKIEDYAETELWISITNASTKISLRKQSDVELTELSDHGISLKLPKTICSLGHLLSISILRTRSNPLKKEPVKAPSKGGPRKLNGEKIEFTAKVTELEPLSRDHIHVVVQFYQYDEKQWLNFQKSYADRQRAAAELIRKIQQ